MASIAYVSDENMLEYHRLNGSKTIAFWRFSNKQFSDFAKDDLLFFLSKGEYKKKEKGIVGYGRYVESKTVSINNAWNSYQQALGYTNKDEFIRALEKNNKLEKLPDKINCLILDQVYFFNMPIYMSELGINITSKLESFTYLDKEDNHTTLRILDEAKKIGVDSWSNIFEESQDFNNHIVKNEIATLIDEIDLKEKVSKKFLDRIKEQYQDIHLISDTVAIRYTDPVNVYFLFESNSKQAKENYIKLIGKLKYIQLYFENKNNCRFNVVTSTKLTNVQKEKLNQLDVDVLFID